MNTSAPKKPSTGILWFGVVCLALFGAAWLILFGLAIGSESSKSSLGGTVLASICLAGLPLLLASILYWTIRKQQSRYVQERASWIQRSTILIAAESGGRVSAAELVMRLHLTPDEARMALEELAATGLAEPLVSESGTMVFEIRGIGKDKASASEI